MKPASAQSNQIEAHGQARHKDGQSIAQVTDALERKETALETILLSC